MFTILWFVIYYRRVSSQLIGKNFSTATISFRDAINFLFKQKAVGVHVKEVYLKYKAAGYKHVCNFNFLASAYVPLDLEVIKTILNKDLNHFTDRGFYSNENCDLLSANLFFVNGQKWQKVRKIISPIFTPKKLKCLVDCLSESSNDLLDTFKKSYDAKEVININDVLNLYALNSFSSCVLGIKDTNTNNEENMLKSVSEKIFEKPSIKRFVKLVISFIKPEVGEYFSIPFFQPEVRNFFEKNIELGIKLRESSGIKRDDILNSLIKLKDDHLNSINGENGIIQEFDENCGLTLNETIAQAFILYVGATDTTGSALLFCIFELCKYPDIQQKLREEINSVLIKHEGKITYDALMDMKYMDLAINGKNTQENITNKNNLKLFIFRNFKKIPTAANFKPKKYERIYNSRYEYNNS